MCSSHREGELTIRRECETEDYLNVTKVNYGLILASSSKFFSSVLHLNR